MVTTLRKNDLSTRVAKRMGGPKTHSEAALNAVVESIQEAMRKGERVVITGFGTFEVRDVKARKIKAIQGEKAGQMITVPKHKRVRFSSGADMQKAAQGKRKIAAAAPKAKAVAAPKAKAKTAVKGKKR